MYVRKCLYNVAQHGARNIFPRADPPRYGRTHLVVPTMRKDDGWQWHVFLESWLIEMYVHVCIYVYVFIYHWLCWKAYMPCLLRVGLSSWHYYFKTVWLMWNDNFYPFLFVGKKRGMTFGKKLDCIWIWWENF